METRAIVCNSVLALLTVVASRGVGAQEPAPRPAEVPAQGATPAPAQGAAPAQPTSSAPAQARLPAESKAGAAFSAEQLEQIVAPIALHPDSLLTMIMMAATYPLEIVEASRWVQKNTSLNGAALESALKQQDWDPSVKSLCSFPTVLKQMNDNLDWTQDLGDAFLGQQKELLDTVQKMRRKALEAGNLKTTEQQKVTEDDKVIVIESTKTEVVYVPTYPPTAVYGSSWYYPTYYYPPMYYPPPPGRALFIFSVGVAWGSGHWGHCDWHGGDVNINVNNFNQFNKNTSARPEQLNRSGGDKAWKHDAAHRKGANYRNPQTAQKYGATAGSNRVAKSQARGYESGAAKNARPAGATPSVGNTGRGTGASGTGNRATPTPQAKPRASTGGSSGSKGALSGSRTPSSDRAASARGSASRGSGAARGGGGGRGRR